MTLGDWTRKGAGLGVWWVATHPVESVAAAAILANPTTRMWGARVGWATGRIAVSAGYQTARAVAVITFEEFIAGTALARGGMTAARFAGAVGAGYAIGAVVGTGIAYAGWGTKGAADAARFYTGRVSIDDYFSTVGSALFR